jgi:hypothetical protein
MARFSPTGCGAALSALLGVSQLIACSSDGSGDASSSGGASSFAGGSSGAPIVGNGGTAAGGVYASNGGTSAAGGTKSNGGASSSGGRMNTGGDANGGASSSGGSASGGASSSGGNPNTGGASSSGGNPNTGGQANTGGNANAGGQANTGGAPGSGGKSCTCQSTGGTPSTGGGTGTGGASGSSSVPVTGGCPMFTSDDEWNRKITSDATDANWTAKLYSNATLKALHPDFGSGFGIPFNVVPQSQSKLTVSFDYKGDSDPGPYPFPGSSAKIEGGTPTNCSGDCHVLAIEQTACLLYEGWNCHYTASSNSWHCGSGAEFDLTKNSYGQRPVTWTSADAAGLAILPGLVKYAEVAAGAVNHAIRFTMHCTQDGYVKPASHQAVPTGKNGCPAGITTADLEANYPPMGLRIRLQSGYDISGMSSQAKIIAQAMKTYGMILADNGSDYFFQGDDDASWDNNQLDDLKNIPGNAFDVVALPGAIGR